MRTKDASADRHARLADSGDNLLYQRSCDRRHRCRYERRSSALAHLTEQGELAHYQNLTFDLRNRSVHQPVVVGKYPQTHDLPAEGPGIFTRVVVGRSHQYEQTRFDPRHGCTLYADRSG